MKDLSTIKPQFVGPFTNEEDVFGFYKRNAKQRRGFRILYANTGLVYIQSEGKLYEIKGDSWSLKEITLQDLIFQCEIGKYDIEDKENLKRLFS